jgi:protein disulfide-isomerase-like protein
MIHHWLFLFAGALAMWTSFAFVVVPSSGTPHHTVQTLTADNFQEALEDPANGLWLLKFWAPWCGHCKRLAPVLDEVAPKVAGQMAIGKIDCTVEKQLCKEYNVKSYPTLKFSLGESR